MESVSPVDLKLMRRCIELSRTAGSQGEFPFACVIAKGEDVIVETINGVARDKDVTCHAELLAVSEAQKKLGRTRLTGYTLYSNVEPCSMCAFSIREARISRVVYALSSPLMGGHSRWDILGDSKIRNAMPEAFGDVEVLFGVLAQEAEKVWSDWNPLIWRIMKSRGCFVRQVQGHIRPPLRSWRIRLGDFLTGFYHFIRAGH
jgi:tRNA(adenine34) deaminase